MYGRYKCFSCKKEMLKILDRVFNIIDCIGRDKNCIF